MAISYTRDMRNAAKEDNRMLVSIQFDNSEQNPIGGSYGYQGPVSNELAEEFRIFTHNFIAKAVQCKRPGG